MAGTPEVRADEWSGRSPNLELRNTDEYGRVLGATSEIPAGDVVLEESPLLHVPPLSRENQFYRQLNNYDNLYQISPTVILKLHAYFQASDSVKSKVLQLFTPDMTTYQNNPVIIQARTYFKTLKEHPPFPEFKVYMEATPEETLTKVWLAWVLNGHRFYGGSALFELGSKLTHSCARPNTKYRTWGTNGTRSYHLAATTIRTGGLLTTNYIGWDYKAIQSTPHRQAFLEEKFLFKCRCTKCSMTLDKLRAVPCPSCSAPHRAADKLLTSEAAYCNTDMGFLLWDPKAADSTAGSDPRKPWKCDRCEEAFEDSAEELWGRYYKRSFSHIEADMEAFALRLDASLEDEPRMGSIQDFSRKIHDIGRLLGARHWASLRLFFVAIRVHCAELERIIDEVDAGETGAALRGDARFCASELMKHCQLLWRLLGDYTDEEPAEVLGPHLNQAAQLLLQLAGARLLRLSESQKLTQQAAQLLRNALPGLIRFSEEVEDIGPGGEGSEGTGPGAGGAARVAEQLLPLLEGMSLSELDEEGEEDEEEGEEGGAEGHSNQAAGNSLGEGHIGELGCSSNADADAGASAGAGPAGLCSRPAVSGGEGGTPGVSREAASGGEEAAAASTGHHVLEQGSGGTEGSAGAAAATRPPGWAAKAKAIQAALREAEADG